MKSYVCFAMLAVLAGVQCARVPAQDEHSVGRARRSSPWEYFNKNKNTKKVVKKKPQPKPTTQATTTSTPVITTTSPRTTSNVKNKMPEYIAEKMGKLQTKDQVLQFLGITTSMSQKINAVNNTLPIPDVSGQNSGSSDLYSSWTKSTACLPRPQVIKFPQRQLYRGVIYPDCTIALRCGGCCNVHMLNCVPDKVENTTFSYYFVPYTYMWPSSQRISRKKRQNDLPEMRQISVENHSSCKCQCKVRPQDCDPKRQYHRESTCQCKCRDDFTESKLNCAEPFRFDEESCSCTCAYEHRYCPVQKQQWDRKQCKCMCDNRIKCPMGFVMNKDSCECEDIKMSDKVPNCKKNNSK